MKKRKRHTGSSLMIRMIDIVFILLFGFIAVSQITQAEAIEPPKSEEALLAAPEGTHVLIIGVQAGDRYSVDGGEKVFDTLSALQRHLEQARVRAANSERELRVRIRANRDVPIASCMRVAKLCRDLGIAKGIDVVKVSR